MAETLLDPDLKYFCVKLQMDKTATAKLHLQSMMKMLAAVGFFICRHAKCSLLIIFNQSNPGLDVQVDVL